MSNETIKTKPPTCRELQTQINDLQKAITQLQDYCDKINSSKVSVGDSWTVTAAVQTGLETAQKYYERSHAVYNDTLAASKQVAKTAQFLTNFERVLANYYRLPWHQRIFRAPKPPRTTEEKK